MTTKKSPVLLCLLFSMSLFGQINNQDARQYEIKKTDQAIKIDGLEDPHWSKANVADGFCNHRPTDIGLAKSQTSVKMLYDEQFIYILVKALNESGKQIIQNLKRDNFFDNDGFGVLLDPINKQTNGVFFGLNSRGSQSECLVESSGNTDWNWDAKWYSKVVQHEGFWIAEIAIPFYTLRYNPTIKSWGINFVRNDLGNNMYATWTAFPTNFEELDLGYTGRLDWNADIPKSRKRIAIIPSVTTTIGKDFEGSESTNLDFTPSLDAKYAITSSLNLDLTLNPDFSQIEVDRQVTNLSRFNLFFPERRTFFLENSDLFTSFWGSGSTPFFSRKIGLNQGQNIPIRFGARLTGNLTEPFRIGILNVQTDSQNEVDAQNYGVMAVQHRILKRSTFGGIFVNRQNTSSDNPDYNRVAGTQFNFSSENGIVNVNSMYFKSFSDGVSREKNDYIGSSVYINDRLYRLFFQAEHMGDNFLTDVGFNPRLFNYDDARDTTIRLNYQRYNIYGALDFRPEDGSMVFHGPRFQNVLFTNNGNQFNERYTYIGYEIDFANQSQFDAGITNHQVKLLFPTGFLSDAEPLPAKTYNYTDLFLDWDSDPRKLFSYGTVFTIGSFYSGQRIGLRSYVQYRIQPWLRVRLDHNINHVDLAEFGAEDFNLFGLRTEVSFSNNIFWTTFFQYNTQAKNVNINSRFQWRFAPMSDFFLVYTDNYLSEPFLPKNRYMSLKINYWLNL